MILNTVKLDSFEGLHEFECYPCDEPINVGDPYLYFFCGMADVTICYSEDEKLEINKHDRPKKGILDLTHGFWRNCYKIKSSKTFDLTQLK